MTKQKFGITICPNCGFTGKLRHYLSETGLHDEREICYYPVECPSCNASWTAHFAFQHITRMIHEEEDQDDDVSRTTTRNDEDALATEQTIIV